MPSLRFTYRADIDGRCAGYAVTQRVEAEPGTRRQEALKLTLSRVGAFTAAAALAVTTIGTPSPSTAGQQAGQLSINASASELAWSASVALTGDFESGGQAVEDVEVELWRKPYAGDWSLVGIDETNAFGSVGIQHTPRKNTRYQWRFLGNEEMAPTQSAEVTVKVHAKLTLRIKDSSIQPGRQFVVTGKTVPKKPGLTVSLWRARISGAEERWFTTKVRSDGTYRFARKVGQVGQWRLYTRIPGGQGNLNAISNSEWLRVG